MIIDGIKMTFLEYPFDIRLSVELDDIVMMPDLLTLAATKAYSLGRRSKWKDYVDLYFILRDYFPLQDVSKEAKKVFGGGFNERLFREQLCYSVAQEHPLPNSIIPAIMRSKYAFI